MPLSPARFRCLAAGAGLTPLRPRLYHPTKQRLCQAAQESSEGLRIKGLCAIAAGQQAAATVPHNVTGLSGEYRKSLGIKRIAGATCLSGATFVAALAPRRPLRGRRGPGRLPPHESIV